MKDSAMTDGELVGSCLQGCLESYRELMGRYSGYARTVAWNILLNREDAEDVCQEAFLRAYRNLPSFDAQRSFKNWFYALLTNLCLDNIRKKKRGRELLERFAREHPAENPGLCDTLASALEVKVEWLRPLSPKERLALCLWAQEGYSGSEIAVVLGCATNTAHIHLFRARRKLKAAMKEG